MSTRPVITVVASPATTLIHLKRALAELDAIYKDTPCKGDPACTECTLGAGVDCQILDEARAGIRVLIESGRYK